jgi:hypothetical protein
MRVLILVLVSFLSSPSLFAIGHPETVLEHIRKREQIGIARHQIRSDDHLIKVKRVQLDASLAARVTSETYVTDRSRSIEKFPCSKCHNGNPLVVSKTKRAHWNIELFHAPIEVMACDTCHLQKNPGELHSLRGKPIAIEHSYQLCAQCHSKQFQDWLGGAHGKRVGGWAPPRVISSCTECHNPHDPKLKKRWPAVRMR